MGDAANTGDLLGDFLRHELPAKAGLGALGNIDLEGVGTQHVVDVPAEAPGKALQDDEVGLLALLVSSVRPPSPVFSEVPERRDAIASATFVDLLKAPKLIGAIITGMLKSRGVAPPRPPRRVRSLTFDNTSASAPAPDRSARNARSFRWGIGRPAP